MEQILVEEALLYGNDETRVFAARELVHLTNKQRHKLAEKGVITPLVSMLVHGQDYEAIEATLLALLSLAFGSERNKIRIAKSGAIPVLVKLIQCQDQSLVDLAIAALLILSSCAANRLAIAASGVIPILMEVLQENYSTHQAKLDTIITLQNLATCPQIIPSVVLTGTVFTLIQLIDSSEKSCELVEKAIALLEKIVSSSEIALTETANTEGGIQALVETVEEGLPQCQEHAVGILLLICQNSRDRYRLMILREGAMPGLLQLSVDGTRRGRELAKSLLLLLRDCSSVGSRSRGSKNALMEQVMGQIDRDEKAGTELRLVEEMIAKLRS